VRIQLRLILFGVVSVASGFGQATESGKASEPFQVTITASKQQFSVGDSVELTVRLTNTSNLELSKGGGVAAPRRGDTSYDYSCRDATGNEVPKIKEKSGILDVGDPGKLEPGESHESTVVVSYVCDLSQPGVYEIQATHRNPGDPEHRWIKSNIIKITVLPPDPPADGQK
jgi:hypothetical protein